MKLNCFKMLDFLWTKWSWILRFKNILSAVLLWYTMMLWHVGPRQSLPKVVGTHIVLDCKWIITVCYTQYTPLPQLLLLKPKHINGTQHWIEGRRDWCLLKFKDFVAFPQTLETDCRWGGGGGGGGGDDLKISKEWQFWYFNDKKCSQTINSIFSSGFTVNF
jgi:hypothetical protein